MSSTKATFVLVHGALHSGWSWHLVENALADRGFASRTVELPSMGDDTASLGGLSDDVSAIQTVIDSVDGPVVLVGHSYGGAPVTQAGDHEKVKHLVYVAATMVDVGENGYDAFPDWVPNWIFVSDDGLAVGALSERVNDALYHDVEPSIVAEAVPRLHRWVSAGAAAEKVTVASWRTRPSTYIVCTADRNIPEASQRIVARHADTVIDLPTSHSPFFSQPEELSDLLVNVAEGVK